MLAASVGLDILAEDLLDFIETRISAVEPSRNWKV